MEIFNKQITYAQIAKKYLDELKLNNEKIDDDKFISLLKGLPSQISQNGLIQTLAFLKSKEEKNDEGTRKAGELKKNKITFEIFSKFAKDSLKIPSEQNNILSYLINEMNDLIQYNYYQKEFLDFAIWLKRIGTSLFAPLQKKSSPEITEESDVSK